jgi:hypothetical protein
MPAKAFVAGVAAIAIAAFIPDSPDEMALGQLRAPISIGKPNSYDRSSVSGVLTAHFKGQREA